MKRFFCAYNIKIGGGITLLNEVLEALPKLGPITIIVNKYLHIPENVFKNCKIIRINGNIFSRLYIESWLFFHVTTDDSVLFFGNYPPIFRLRGAVKVFLQNRFLVDHLPPAEFSLRFKLKVAVQKILFRLCVLHANDFYVQTTSMANLLRKLIPARANIAVHLAPFSSSQSINEIAIPDPLVRENDFIYVASGDAHKNHYNLIEAWVLLAKDGCFPSLVLTVDPISYPELAKHISSQSAKYGLNILNVGFLKMAEVRQGYANSRALIYPSLLESFGLPLLEAKSFKLPILASELDYVRDVVDPEFTFDPLSSVSISRAVKRFLRFDELGINLLTPVQFLESTMGSLEKH